MRYRSGNLIGAVAAGFCGVLLSACGGTGAVAAGGEGTNGVGSVGAGGGSVSLPSGPTIAVPAGALSASTSITITASPASPPTGAVSGVFQFGPAGTTFGSPVTVSFPVPAGTQASDVAVYWTRPGSAAEWETLLATVTGMTATTNVTHFSSGYVGLRPLQCNVLTGAWTFTSHCSNAYLGKQLVIAQQGCSITTTEPVTGQALTAQVTGNAFTAGACPATVTGNTMDMQCPSCPVTLARQAMCVTGQACTPPGTVDPCKSYSTTCSAGGAQTCVAAGDKPDGSACGSGLTCSAGNCGSGVAIDISGTWSGALTQIPTLPDGSSPGLQPLQQAQTVTKVGNVFTATVVNGWGVSATCTGTLIGTSIVGTCDAATLDGTCTGTYPMTGTVTPGSPMKMTTDSTFKLGGGSCAAAGTSYHYTGSLTRRDTPPLDISGSYTVDAGWTKVGPGPIHAIEHFKGTRVRAQAGCAVTSKTTTPSATFDCRGVILDGNAAGTVYESCIGIATDGGRYTGSSEGTVSSFSGGTWISSNGDYAIKNDPAGFTSAYLTVAETRVSALRTSR
jgi:hypothetical protein